MMLRNLICLKNAFLTADGAIFSASATPSLYSTFIERA